MLFFFQLHCLIAMFFFSGSKSLNRRPQRKGRGQRSVSRPLIDNYATSDVALQVRGGGGRQAGGRAGGRAGRRAGRQAGRWAGRQAGAGGWVAVTV